MYVLFRMSSGDLRMTESSADVFVFSSQYFIRQNTAATLAHRMQYLNEPVREAARSVVEALRREEGVGGVIALDNQGNGKLNEVLYT